MIKRNLNLFKKFPYLILILVLVVSSCGIKHTIKNVCNVENIPAKTQKGTTSCQFVQLAEHQLHHEVSLNIIQFYKSHSSGVTHKYFEEADSNSSSKTGSIPLYILYKQLRSNLI